MKKKRIPLFLVKLMSYEYWPFWLFFMPLVPYWIYLSIRAKSFTYFTAANPGIEHSGVFGESKIDILKKIDPHYLPKTMFFKSDTSVISNNEDLYELLWDGTDINFDLGDSYIPTNFSKSDNENCPK